MIFNLSDYENKLPLPANEKWKEGVWDIEVFKNGTMSLQVFAPKGIDYQTPHDQDEIYIVIDGSGKIEIEGIQYPFSPGTAIFVAAGKKHKFIGNHSGIKLWVVFYGVKGGERNSI